MAAPMTVSPILKTRVQPISVRGSQLEAGPPDEGFAWLDEHVACLVKNVVDPAVKLTERLRLQGLACDRLDEFFAEQLHPGWSVLARAHALTMALHENWRARMRVELAETCGIRLSAVAQLTPEQQSRLKHDVARKIWPLLTPLAVDQGHPFPVLSDRRLSLAVALRKECQCVVRRDRAFAIITIPSIVGRMIELRATAEGPKTFVLIEEVIAANIAFFFPGFRVTACSPFRITRARLRQSLDIHQKSPLHARQAIVRLELADAPPDVESYLQSQFGLEAADVCRMQQPIHLGELSALAAHVHP
jgi:polyphosphate kinase